jgi:hypothetical protein
MLVVMFVHLFGVSFTYAEMGYFDKWLEYCDIDSVSGIK